MAEQNTRLGILLMILTTFVFSVQDAVSRHLGDNYPVEMIVMIRYWFFGVFVMVLATRQAGGLRKAAKTGYPLLQVLRGTLLVLEIGVMVVAFTLLGLVETHAVFVCYPLLVAALSGPVLGERVGWRRWLAIGVGFLGVLIVLEPGFGVFSVKSLVPLAAALMFAVYGLLTRYVSRRDTSATSFFWTGVTGAVISSVWGIWYWTPMTGGDWIWMGLLCMSGALGHYLLIRVYELAEASAVQPFAYFQLGFASVIGMIVFGEVVRLNVAIGAAVIVGAGLFTFWRERRAQQQA
ncbi:DMT family transporter [Pseudooceanicola nanhaiensis]|uniref:DMT family transporter n=1 Tax=Pseudooceanicola nanhaiensis TaxID=375761 RepID=UPI001CD2A6BE|nr:DMT family transporter [Pseudooceanicola nanhaiensis]MCA0920471.1 DMT family transporter [Pseudooceanicola nanhaiensis]